MAGNCRICKGPLNVPDMPLTDDCGGDCLRCMAVHGQDPDCQHAMVQAFAADFKKLVRQYFPDERTPFMYEGGLLSRCQDNTSLFSPYIWSK